MKILVIPAPGVGDALILHIVSHHLSLAGHEVITDTPHRFGNWLDGYRFGNEEADAIFLQYDNTERSKQIYARPSVYTFYGSHQLGKHAPLKPGFDFVADHDLPMVDNIVVSLKTLFGISATKDNGFRPPLGLIHRKYRKRVILHTTSGNPHRNWPLPQFLKVARWLTSEGYEPVILPQLNNLNDLASYIYESGYFLGNDSGPGHLASLLDIPHLIIGREERHMRHWRPGWRPGEILTPPHWIPNWKGLLLREKHWKHFITPTKVINCLNRSVLRN